MSDVIRTLCGNLPDEYHGPFSSVVANAQFTGLVRSCPISPNGDHLQEQKSLGNMKAPIAEAHYGYLAVHFF